MFRAAIFDMDGTLVNSEGCWKNAEREVFGAVGIEITDAMAAVTAPMTPRQVTEHWYRHKPWAHASHEDMEAAVVRRVAEQLRDACVAMPGARQALDLCQSLGWKLALASNSPASLCRLVLERLELAARFDTLVSVDDVASGKPDPDIYLLAARRLCVEPRECLAFEDTPVGVNAALAAGMRVVAIPSAGQDFTRARPHLLLRGLDEFGPHHAGDIWRSGL